MILWEILINYIEENPDLAKGHFSGPTRKETQRKLWIELASILGFGKKTIQKWQKVNMNNYSKKILGEKTAYQCSTKTFSHFKVPT